MFGDETQPHKIRADDYEQVVLGASSLISTGDRGPAFIVTGLEGELTISMPCPSSWAIFT